MRSKNVTIYVKEIETFEKMCDFIRKFWWDTYKESLTNSDIMYKGIVKIHNQINEELNSKTNVKLSDKYGRINDN